MGSNGCSRAHHKNVVSSVSTYYIEREALGEKDENKVDLTKLQIYTSAKGAICHKVLPVPSVSGNFVLFYKKSLALLKLCYRISNAILKESPVLWDLSGHSSPSISTEIVLVPSFEFLSLKSQQNGTVP